MDGSRAAIDMASSWGFGNLSTGGSANGDAPKAGPNLGDVTSDDITFQDVADNPGNRVRLSEQWPEDQLPPTTASLLSIASGRGLLAAATPNGLVIVGTEKARVAFLSRREQGNDADKIRNLEADVTLQTPRLSHVAFSADESCLVIVSEQGGGLAVYNTDTLSNGAQPAFSIATNGTSVRHLLPNPNSSAETSHLFGIVLSDGKLLLADLKNQSLVNGIKGDAVFHENVSSAAWSKLGKRIIAGLADSTAAQIDPQGNVKDTIPRPPQLSELQSEYDGAQALPITSISWLQTYEFLLVFSPSYPQPPDMANHDSVYFIARRTKTTPFTFHKIDMDPCPPFGMSSRTPAHHFMLRASEWVNIQDLLVVASSASTDLGIFAHLKEDPSKSIPDEFVTWMIESEGRRALLPLNPATESDTSAVGMAMDLSAKEVPPRPIPDEADLFPHSPIALPLVCVLTNDGVLNMWWVVYKDAIRGKTLYPGMIHKNGRYAKYKKYNRVELAAVEGDNPYKDSQDQGGSGDETEPMGDGSTAPAPSAPSSFAPATQNSSSLFGSSSTPKPQPAFGQSNAPSFGGSSALGSKPSPWGAPAGGNDPKPSLGHTFGQPAFGSASTPGGTGSSTFGQPSTPAGTSGFGKFSGGSAFGQASQLGGPSPFAKASTEGGSAFGQNSKPAETPAFGTPSGGSAFGQPSKPAETSAFGKPSTPGGGSAFGQTSQMGEASGFGKPSTPGGGFSGFGKPSTPGQTPAFGQPSQPAGGSLFGKPSQPAAFGKPSTFGQTSQPGGGNTGKPNPFANNAGAGSPFSAFASGDNASKASPFATAMQQGKATPFSGFGSKTPALSQETSTGSTATIGSSGVGSFGQASTFPGSSFASKPTISQESTMKDDDNTSKNENSGGLFGLGSGGFKLGSGFKGDGTAKDDGPKPANPGAGLFGADFGKSLGESAPKNRDPPIKEEPSDDQGPALKDIPVASSKAENEPPLPPDPTAKSAVSDDAPLPPDPSTYKAPSFPNDLPGMPNFGKANVKKDSEKDIPIAGSPPLNVTNSQTFSPTEGSEAAGPSDDGSEEWDEEDEEGDEDDDEYDEDEDEDEEGEDDEEEDDTAYEPTTDQGRADLAAFTAKLSPASPKREPPSTEHTPQSEEKTQHSSYTPAGLPKGPVFPLPGGKVHASPRSPSPQRAVTSPVGRMPQRLPSQIKTSAVPPAKPIERPAAPPKPREPTQGELEDEADDRLKAYLAAPPEPTKDLPEFFTHTDYAGATDKPGLGGQIEKVYRDVNSMIDTVGLNAKGLSSFLLGQETLRKDGQRTKEDLDQDDEWCLGDIGDLSRVLDGLGKQLQDGRLDRVREKIEDLVEEQKEVLRLKGKKDELRKQVTAHTDPERRAMQELAPLSTETQAQQADLRHAVQRVQKLLSEVEQRMTMLRADLASFAQHDNAANGRTPVPTVEAVTNTILKMTAMVEQKSGDIDVLEAQIKRLPNGIASLRLEDDYEDDIASRLASNKLLSDSPSRTPQRRPRMAANGDALGMSAMFGGSRFQTPPSASLRRSVRFTPDTSAALGRSTGSLSGSTRKKMIDVTEQEVQEYNQKVDRRRNVLGALKARMEEKGARTVKVE